MQINRNRFYPRFLDAVLSTDAFIIIAFDLDTQKEEFKV